MWHYLLIPTEIIYTFWYLMTGETMLDVREDGPDVISIVRSCICSELVVTNMVSLTYVAWTVFWLLYCCSRSTAWMRLSILNFRLFNFMTVADLVTRKAQTFSVRWWKWDLRQALVFYRQHVRGWRRWMDCPKIALSYGRKILIVVMDTGRCVFSNFCFIAFQYMW